MPESMWKSLVRNNFEQTAQIVQARNGFAVHPARQSEWIDTKGSGDASLLIGVPDDLGEQVTPRLWLLHIRFLTTK